MQVLYYCGEANQRTEHVGTSIVEVCQVELEYIFNQPDGTVIHNCNDRDTDLFRSLHENYVRVLFRLVNPVCDHHYLEVRKKLYSLKELEDAKSTYNKLLKEIIKSGHLHLCGANNFFVNDDGWVVSTTSN